MQAPYLPFLAVPVTSLSNQGFQLESGPQTANQSTREPMTQSFDIPTKSHDREELLSTGKKRFDALFVREEQEGSRV